MTRTFPRTRFYRRGYAPQWVDAFFVEAKAAYEGLPPGTGFDATDVQQATFPLQRGGYAPQAVDGALNRLQAAFIQREQQQYVAQHGEEQWHQLVADRATTLYPRLLRPEGEKFSHPEGRRGVGYDAEQVDDLLLRLTRYFDNGVPLQPADVRGAYFKSARGQAAYREDQVDAYLARAVEILLAAG